MFTNQKFRFFLAAGAVLIALALGLQLVRGNAQAQLQAQGSSIANYLGVRQNTGIPYPGYLNNMNGEPVSDGNYDFTFNLYTSKTSESPLWSESQIAVPVKDGAFQVQLGSVQAIPSTALENENQWLEVAVKGPGEAFFTTLAPRQSLTSTEPTAPDSPSAAASCPHDHVGEVWSGNIGWANAAFRVENSSNGPSIWGYNTGGGNAIRGNATGSGLGVYGESQTSAGIVGRSTSNPGGHGIEGYSNSISKAGVYGKTECPTIGDAYGVMGETGNTSGTSAGVYGKSTAGSGIGVYGYSTSSTGWAGWFGSPTGNGVTINVGTGKVGLVVSGGGSKSAAVTTDQGIRLLYSEESTQVWFSDYGFGTLQDGVAVIHIDPLFAQTVNLQEPYHVFLQVYGNAELYVTDRTPTQFQVDMREGDSNVEFSYRIVAIRLGYEEDRLELAPPGAGEDENLYPRQ